MPASGAANPGSESAAPVTPKAATPVSPESVTDDEFAACMAALGPYESKPRIAVAVSGGPDSMALAILAQAWASARGGKATALIVDHGLRPESAGEAKQVARWLSRRHLAPKILPWTGPRPKSGLPAAARDARYELLEAWCADQGVLHLLLGHQQEDQAETLLMRLGRGSGLDGLSAMAPIVERTQIRLLRPLLNLPRARLTATLLRSGQPWVEDPTNQDTNYARARLRAALPALGEDGLAVARLAKTAHHLGRARQALEAQCDRLLAQAAFLHPAGFLHLAYGPLSQAPAEIALRVLARAVRTISGSLYAPRVDRLQRLYKSLSEQPVKSRTLAGCRITLAGNEILIYREMAAIAPPLTLVSGMSTRWDGRLLVQAGPKLPPGLTIAPLGAAGWRHVRDQLTLGNIPNLPNLACPSLPAIWHNDHVIAVPHLNFWPKQGGKMPLTGLKITFKPIRALSTAQFFIV